MLGLVEGELRIAGVPDPGLVEGDPACLWWLRPNLDRDVPFGDRTFHVSTNALGLRGPPPPPEGPWTLVLGCSTTFGWGVEADEAWPARLGAHLGEAVVNGGVPGWSTQQAVLGAGRYLALQPTRVVLAYIVRDAQAARVPDTRARPTPFLLRLNLARLIAGSRPPVPPGGDTFRVPPEAYADNLRTLVAMAAPAQVVLLAFPQPEPLTPWVEAMRTVGPVLAPQLAVDSFFEEDPIHLSAEGNERLAALVAATLDGR